VAVQELGQAALQGWRGKVADTVATPVAKRTPLREDWVRAGLGLTFLALSVLYVIRSLAALRSARR
jgi:hypothetical protein